MPPGQSNLASTQIGVPRALQPDIQALNRTCQASDLDADRCPTWSSTCAARRGCGSTASSA
jgi:hypothetical protein